MSIDGNWHLLTLTLGSKRDLFFTQIGIAIEREKLDDLILKVELPEDVVYQNLVLVKLGDFKAARARIQQMDYVQRLDPKPLKPEQVNRILGKNMD